MWISFLLYVHIVYGISHFTQNDPHDPKIKKKKKTKKKNILKKKKTRIILKKINKKKTLFRRLNHNNIISPVRNFFSCNG